MYQQYFGFSEWPFSIVPNSRYLYLSQRHQEAIRYLKTGLTSGGGMAMLTGEVGTGKTTVAKSMLNNLESSTKAALILNPTFSSVELLQAICDEYSIEYTPKASLKDLTQAIHHYLLSNHASGVQTLLVIDEAQHLAPDVLEQLRLLTNLETESHKLLKVLLVGQPELQQKLQWPQLRQLAQRITGRYHLLPLNDEETGAYIQFRLRTAGGSAELFSKRAVAIIARYTQGIPRLINLVCDEALKQAHNLGTSSLTPALVTQACEAVMAYQMPTATVEEAAPKNHAFAYVSALLIGCASAYALTPYIERLSQQVMDQWVTEPQEIVQVEVTTQTRLAEPAVAFLHQGLTLEGAVSDLYQLWGFSASVLDSLCLDRGESLFDCSFEQGDIAQLRALNLPVVATLEFEGQRRYAVISALSDGYFTLYDGDQQLQLPLPWLDQLWNGEYRYLWQNHFDQTLRQGMQGEQVGILASKLAEVLGHSRVETTTFDSELKQRVEAFQRWQGMTVDGIAGRKTLTRLEHMTQTGSPTLIARQEVQ
ncbi:AAA family ATPase [Vibrio sp. WXL210]|uniref:AAA family ATPase n=1 Tax=Vibrio sp. WXL210 TaxID=3450709 RepID=UPI003EC5089A